MSHMNRRKGARKVRRKCQAETEERGMGWTYLPLRHLLKAELWLWMSGDEANEGDGGEKCSEVHVSDAVS